MGWGEDMSDTANPNESIEAYQAYLMLSGMEAVLEELRFVESAKALCSREASRRFVQALRACIDDELRFRLLEETPRAQA